MTAALLDDGSPKHSSREFVNAVDFLGATLFASTDEEKTIVTLGTLTKHLGEALPLMGEWSRSRPSSTRRWSASASHGSRRSSSSADQPTVVANQVFQRVVYGEDHPYGRPLMGTQESVTGIKRDELAAFHDRYYVPNGATLIAVGDITEKDLMPRLEAPSAPGSRQRKRASRPPRRRGRRASRSACT